jgi:hypothetical protein
MGCGVVGAVPAGSGSPPPCVSAAASEPNGSPKSAKAESAEISAGRGGKSGAGARGDADSAVGW